MNNYSQDGAGSLSNVVDFMAYKRAKTSPIEVLKKYYDHLLRCNDRGNTYEEMEGLLEQRRVMNQDLHKVAEMVDPDTVDEAEQLILSGSMIMKRRHEKRSDGSTLSFISKYASWKGQVEQWGEALSARVAAI